MSSEALAIYYGSWDHEHRRRAHGELSDGMHAMGRRFPAVLRAGEVVWFDDLYGNPRWLTRTGMRVMYECLALIAAGTSARMREIAASARCSTSTVSKVVCKLTAWGIIGSACSRGRYGGLVLFARSKTDTFERFAIAARERLWRAAEARKARLFGCAVNVRTDIEQTVNHSTYKVRTLKSEHDIDLVARDQELAVKLGCVDPTKRVICPVHGTKDRNLSWAWGRNGRLLVKCWSHQCTYDEIRRAAGL